MTNKKYTLKMLDYLRSYLNSLSLSFPPYGET